MKLIFLNFVLTLFSTAILAQENPEIINSVPDNLPIKVEVIKPDNIEGYPAEISVKITNSGNKPIYSVRLILDMEDAPEKKLIAPNGTVPFIGFDFNYGRKNLSSSHNEKPTDEDKPIKPNETVILRINPYTAKVTKNNQIKKHGRMPTLYRLIFVDLTFGDGTGFTKRGAFPRKAN